MSSKLWGHSDQPSKGKRSVTKGVVYGTDSRDMAYYFSKTLKCYSDINYTCILNHDKIAMCGLSQMIIFERFI